MTNYSDSEVRIAVFDWLSEITSIHGDVLPRNILSNGFYFNNERITLIGPQGIWKPKLLDLPISITTIINGPYDDSDEDNGIFIYKYRGTDPNHYANVGLRNLMNLNIPLIYFHQIEINRYLVTWPIYVINEDRNNHSFFVAADGIMRTEDISENTIHDSSVEYRRSYLTAQVKQRIHQRSFRERVINAYGTKCAFCSLKHRELLDAAHIIPDNEKGGEPIVLNGLSLCKIHHAAFDSNILGVSPDYSIKVREDILNESDGPMLKYGLQSFNDKRIILPNNKANWPDRDRLYTRYNRFLNI